MEQTKLRSVLSRLVLALTLFGAALLRYNVISLIYLLALLVLPLLPWTRKLINAFLLMVLCYAMMVTLAHLISQVLTALPSTMDIFEPCTATANILHQVGFMKFQGLQVHQVFRVFSIDPVVAAVALTVFLLRQNPADVHIRASANQRSRLWSVRSAPPETRGGAGDETLASSVDPDEDLLSPRNPLRVFGSAIRRAAKPITDLQNEIWRVYFINSSVTLATVACCFYAGVVSPSVISLIYFIVTLLEMITWAFTGRLITTRFFYVTIFLCVCSGVHVLLHYLYQFPFSQTLLTKDTIHARLMGFYQIVHSNCSLPGKLGFDRSLRWFDYLAPPITMALYFLAATEVRRRITLSIRQKSQNAEVGAGEESSREQTVACDNPMYSDTHTTIPLLPMTRRRSHREGSICEEEPLRRALSSGANESLIAVSDASPSTGITLRPEQPFIVSLALAALQHSYVLAFVAMLGWSVVYVSWLSFLLLLGGCLLWCIPNNTRRAFLYCSPALVLYATAMICIQFVYALNLDHDELPEVVNEVNLREVGLQKAHLPLLDLTVQFLCLFAFLLTLRLFLNRRGVGQICNIGFELSAVFFLPTTQRVTADNLQDNRLFLQLARLTRTLCYKYWIILCCVMFLIMSLQTPPVAFRIGYLGGFLYFMFVFQMSYPVWRKQMLAFWWIVVIYSMLGLCCIYTFQFEMVPALWNNFTRLEPNVLSDLGLAKFETTQLLARLLTPVTFIVFVQFQLQFFHSKFLQFTSLHSSEENQHEWNKDVDERQQMYNFTGSTHEDQRHPADLNKLQQRRVDAWTHRPIVRAMSKWTLFLYHLMWRVGELHTHKLVCLLALALAVYEVCALNLVLVLLLACFMPFRATRRLLSTAVFLWVGVCLLLNMIFQLKTLRVNLPNACSENATSLAKPPFNSTLHWFGVFRELHYLPLKGFLLFVTLFDCAAAYHQRAVPNALGESHYGGIFGRATRSTRHKSLITQLQFHINYLFYHLGLELCFSMTVLCAAVRLDVFSVLYLMSVTPFMFISRRTSRVLWLPYCIWLAVWLPLQYSSSLGLPPFLCWPYFYPNLRPALKEWLYLPNYDNPPNSLFLFADFFQFLFACCQYQSFGIETLRCTDEHHPGDNISVTTNHIPENLNEDFVTNKVKVSDYVKHAACYSFYWVVLGMLFLYGVLYTNIFCLGYLLSSFIFLWMGHAVMLKKRRILLRLWNCVLAYQLIVLFAKTGLHLFVCLNLPEQKCWFMQFMGCVCFMTAGASHNSGTSPCDVKLDGSAFMVTCFVLTIFQRRVFSSVSFSFVVFDLMVKNKFSSRGAALINKRLKQDTKEQNEREEIIIKKVSQKVEKLRQKAQEQSLITLYSHDLVIRSGDYYQFDGDPLEEDEEEGVDEIIESARKQPQTPPPDSKDPVQSSAGPVDSLDLATPTPASPSGPWMGIHEGAESSTQTQSPSAPTVPAITVRPSATMAAPQTLSTTSGGGVGPGCGMTDSLVQLRSLTESHSRVSAARTLTTYNPLRLLNIALVSGPVELAEEMKREVLGGSSHNLNTVDSASSTNRDSIHLLPVEEVSLVPSACATVPPSPLQVRSFSAHTDTTKPDQIRQLSPTGSDSYLSAHDEEGILGSTSFVNRPVRRRSVLWHKDAADSSVIQREEFPPRVLPEGEDQPRIQDVEVETGSETAQQKAGCCGKLMACVTVLGLFLVMLLDGALDWLKIHTNEYRQLRDNLNKEQLMVKEALLRTYRPTSPAAKSDKSTTALRKSQLNSIVLQIMEARNVMLNETPTNTKAVSSVPNLAEAPVQTSNNMADVPVGENQSQVQSTDKSRTFRLFAYLVYLIGMYSSSVCFLLMVVNHLYNASLLSVVYPLLVFLWGMFSVPRPGKRFWIFVITYTELLVIIKYTTNFYFQFPSSNSTSSGSTTNPLSATPSSHEKMSAISSNVGGVGGGASVGGSGHSGVMSIVGIEKDNNGITLDMLVLVAVFMHRSYLKNNGLWHDHFVLDDKHERDRRDRLRQKNVRLSPPVSPSAVSHPLEGTGDGEQQEDNVTDSEEDILKEPPIQSPDEATLQTTVSPTQISSSHSHRRSANPLYAFRRFFRRLTNPIYNVKVDLYVYIFLFEFLSFFTILAGYADFGTGEPQSDNAIQFIQQNRIPVPFLCMLVVQFVFILIDRALFLSKNVLAKFVFQILHVILIHVWLFFILPNINDRRPTQYLAPMVLYLFKCLYFTASAYQVKSGYPHRVLGNFLIGHYGYVNLILFKGYLQIPFLYELRSMLDWLWTDTSLTLAQWMTVEDVMAKVFVLKCWRHVEEAYPQRKAVPYLFIFKIFSAGFLILFIFICLWGPLALATLFDVAAISNTPVECSLAMTFQGYPTFFSYTTTEDQVMPMNKTQFTHLKTCLARDLAMKQRFELLGIEDLVLVDIDGRAGPTWPISPFGYEWLLNVTDPSLNVTSKSSLNLQVEFTCRRDFNVSSNHAYVQQQVSLKYKLKLLPYFGALHSLLSAALSRDPAVEPHFTAPLELERVFFPLFYLDDESMQWVALNSTEYNNHLNLTLVLHRANHSFWWELRQRNDDDSRNCFLSSWAEATTPFIRLFTLSRRILPGYFGFWFQKVGILGLYAAYLLVAHRLLRSLYDGIAYNIAFNEMPCVDRIFRLCQDIYLVRENRLFEVEETMVARLFFMFRSYETLIKWTRLPTETIQKFSVDPDEKSNNLSATARWETKAKVE